MWRWLVEVVADPTAGHNKALADKSASKHGKVNLSTLDPTEDTYHTTYDYVLSVIPNPVACHSTNRSS